VAKIKEILSTFFFLGYFPYGSGTVGSLGALAIVFCLLHLPADIPFGAVCIALTVTFFIIGVPLGNWAEIRYNKKDPGQFVLDEVMAFFIPFIPYQLYFKERPRLDEILVAFFLSRFFDVLKPQPARSMEKLKGGWGIMLDDLIAGIYALIGILAYNIIRSNPTF